MTVPPPMDNREGDDGSRGPERLPLRWAFILLAATTAGAACGYLAGVPVGFGAGIAALGILHKVVG